MSKKTKVLKYKVVNTSIDKKFIGKNIDLERVKAKSGPKTKPRAKAPVWFTKYEKRNNQRLDKIENNVSNLRSDFNRVVKLNNLKH